MAGQGGARELRIADNEPAGTFCDFHTSSLTKRGRAVSRRGVVLGHGAEHGREFTSGRQFILKYNGL